MYFIVHVAWMCWLYLHEIWGCCAILEISCTTAYTLLESGCPFMAEFDPTSNKAISNLKDAIGYGYILPGFLSDKRSGSSPQSDIIVTSSRTCLVTAGRIACCAKNHFSHLIWATGAPQLAIHSEICPSWARHRNCALIHPR